MLKIFRPGRLLAAAALVLTFGLSSFADTLRLKDGSIIKGRIVSFGDGKFTVVVGDGTRKRQMSFDASEIESIHFDAAIANASPVSDRASEANDDTRFIETSAPPKSVPRVITKDNTAGPTQKAEPQRTVTAPAAPAADRTGRKPIEVSVKVMADNTSNGWTNSGWVVRKGQRIRIIGNGSVSLGKGKTTTPSGLYDFDDPSKLLKSVPTGALIAVIGDDNNEFIYVGSERTFVATRDGALFLGVNEGNLGDNSGAFDVRVEFDPS